MDSSMARHQGLLFGNACLVAVVGLLSGFLLMFSVLGRIELWPLFASEMTVPGELRAWRAAHVGCLMNALLCGFGAMALPYVAAGRARAFVVYGLIATAWANTAFYVFGAFGRTHGLSGYDVPGLGQGNAFDVLAFLPAGLASGVTIACMIVIAKGAFRGARQP
jgi:hypothetical protein